MEGLVGKTIKGYELRARIGAGGFGAVYRAYQSTVGREVAIKIILPGFTNHPDFIRRFEAEAQLVARLEHLHIAPLYDYWREPVGAYLVMRYLRGGSLRRVLMQGSYALEEAALLMDQVTSALSVAHRQGVIHRDIKPENILLDEDGNAYLADFGIAKELGLRTSDVTAEDALVGSPDYLAPEQARSESVTPKTDIYSLGVVLYEMLAGEHPFPDLSPVERLFKHINNPVPEIKSFENDLSQALNEVIQKATAKKPDNRFDDARAMAIAFREAAGLSASESAKSLVELLTPREQGEWGSLYRRTDPHSFPSGHAARATMLAVLVVGLGPAWLVPIMLVWAPLVTLSRVAMDLHFLSDAVAGAVLGIAVGIAMLLLV